MLSVGRHDDAFGVRRQFIRQLADQYLTLSGNWQFTLANPPDGSFLGGLQGGFLLQNNWLGDGSCGLLRLVATTRVPVQQRIGSDHRNDQRPEQ